VGPLQPTSVRRRRVQLRLQPSRRASSSFQAATGQAVSYTVKSSPHTSLCVRFDDAGDLNYTVQVDGGDPTPTALLAAGDTLQVPIPPAAAQAQLLVWPASYDSADDAGDAAISWALLLLSS
jgi:hypothetical protein